MKTLKCLGLVAALFLSACGLYPKEQETSSPKGNLGSIRSALSIYYGDLEGQYPEDIAALTIAGKYLNSIPAVGPLGNHPASSSSRFGTKPTDEGGWLYNNVVKDANVGNIMINCTHTDVKGSVWASY
ncbi:MAG: hypothetical protein HYX59_11725 [Elusimicrobia bacterium]|nr:hypothetical protein [Elusimicrobiota bacterium]